MYNFIKYSNYDYYAYFTLYQIVTHMLQLLQATLRQYLWPYLAILISEFYYILIWRVCYATTFTLMTCWHFLHPTVLSDYD